MDRQATVTCLLGKLDDLAADALPPLLDELGRSGGEDLRPSELIPNRPQTSADHGTCRAIRALAQVFGPRTPKAPSGRPS